MGKNSYTGKNDVDIILEMSVNNNYFVVEDGLIKPTQDAKLNILNKLYELASNKLYKLDASFKEINDSKGDHKKYKPWDMICETTRSLKDTFTKIKNVDKEILLYIQYIETAIRNIENNRQYFVDSYTYDAMIIQQSYVLTIASIIFIESYLIVAAIDYERKNEKIEFKNIVNSISKLNHGIPKFMIDYILKFNDMCDKKELAKIVNSFKNSHEAFTIPLVIAGGIIGVLYILIPLIRWLIYYFSNLKLTIADFLDIQATYLDYNINKLRRQGADEKIILKQMKSYEFLKKTSASLKGIEYIEKFNVELSKDKYDAMKKTEQDIKDENSELSKNDNMEENKEIKENDETIIF